VIGGRPCPARIRRTARVTGRTKDIVIRGGMNISVREIEDLLLEHAGVRSAAVVGMPDERLGERLCCYVVPSDPTAPPSLDDLKSYLQERVQGIPRAALRHSPRL
jgi:non-ribosomal peptide synthetase component E (peptide arylation enzyme)